VRTELFFQPAKPGVSNLRPAGQIRPVKQNHPACSPLTKL